MARIATLTANPALDLNVVVPRVMADHKLRCSAPIREPGGGGINVARAIRNLGGDARAMFPVGGATGQRSSDGDGDRNRDDDRSEHREEQALPQRLHGETAL